VHGGKSGLIEGLERAFEGLEKGARVDVTLPPEDVFGVSDPSLTIVEEMRNVPPEYRRLGAEVAFQNDQGDTKVFRVTRIGEGKLTLDGNHPMAGQDAVCHAEIVDIRDATAGELASGLPEDASQWGRM
jgi:FKBP-type peptidyl-prolyl cis-trans isomerase SlyD